MDGLQKRQKLRGKTGCLSCRARRKKCDEKRPVCERCSLSGRTCEWPTSKLLIDRRHICHPRSRHCSNNPSAPPVCHRFKGTAHLQLSFDLELVVSRHFIEKYFSFLLLPNCHPEFHNGWIRDIKELMVEDRSLRYSVLANAASHMHNDDTNPGMQSLAVHYYHESIKDLSSFLTKASDHSLAKSDGCLMSMMFLYLHGCMGRGTYDDIPSHLHAAMCVLNLRLSSNHFAFQRPFDYLAVESVLYQIFLCSTGLWSDETPPATFDLEFWQRAEEMLQRSALVPGDSTIVNSPVLGVPVSLFRLAAQSKQILQQPEIYGDAMSQVREEIGSWEATVLLNCPVVASSDDYWPSLDQDYYESTSHLYTLIISLLLGQASEPAEFHSKLPRVVPRESWQIQKAIYILQRRESDVGWLSCYMGIWVVYTLGFFLQDAEDIALIRNELRQRWEATKFMVNMRFLNDLEVVWAARSRTRYCMEIDTNQG